MAKYDVIVIGAGHNGLVNAAYMARAGRKVLVARKARARRGRHRHRGDRPWLQVLGVLLRRQPAAAGDHRGARAREARAAPPRARRDLHAATGRALPRPMARLRAHAPGDLEVLAEGRRQLRAVRPPHAPHVARRPRSPHDAAARAELAEARRPRRGSPSSPSTSKASATAVSTTSCGS